jgi:hypothetical protein
MSTQTYKGFEIETAQDSLGNWHATVHDAKEEMTLATVPGDGKYGTTQEQQAVYAAKGLIERTLGKGY